MSVAISRGQDAQIALKLESLLSSNGNVHIAQSDIRYCNMGKSTKSNRMCVLSILTDL